MGSSAQRDLLPIILVFILLLIKDQRLVGELKNTRLYNVLGGGNPACHSPEVFGANLKATPGRKEGSEMPLICYMSPLKSSIGHTPHENSQEVSSFSHFLKEKSLS